jgi:hypothetical protein
VISNGKDQTLKLWDLRKMASSSDFLAIKDQDYGIPDFDYRYVNDSVYVRHSLSPDRTSIRSRCTTAIPKIVRL